MASIGAVIAAPAFAATGHAGELDTSWNHSGYTTTSVGSGGFSGALGVAVNGNQVLAVGAEVDSSGNQGFGLARYNKDGSLDTSFGTGGTTTTLFPGTSDDQANAVAYQGDKAVVVGQASADGGVTFNFALARYNKNGSLDTSFGTGGLVVTSFGGGYDFANAVVVKGDSIIVAGVTRPTGGHNELIVAQYTKSGALDPHFGTGGYTTTDFNGNPSNGNSLVLSGGDIIVAGYVTHPAHDVFAVAAFTNNGKLDQHFGTGGKVTTDFGADAFGAHVDASGGKIVVIGSAEVGTREDFAAAMYDSKGNLVPSFNGGTATMSTGSDDFGYSGGFEDGTNVVAIGTAGSESSTFAVGRWTQSGGTDPSFGGGAGFVVTPIDGSSSSGAFAGSFGLDDRIVAVGFADSDFAIASYLSD